MKRLTNLDEKIPTMDGSESKLETYRIIIRMLGNTKADTADNARRLTRILNKLRDAKVSIDIESDDLAFVAKRFEENPMGLTAWAQGVMLEYFDSAERVDQKKKDA